MFIYRKGMIKQKLGLEMWPDNKRTWK